MFMKIHFGEYGKIGISQLGRRISFLRMAFATDLIVK